jgi:hypothetical protein
MFLEVTTTIVSKVEFTEDDESGSLQVVGHDTNINPGGLPAQIAYAIALGGIRATDGMLSERLGTAPSIESEDGPSED